MKILFLLVLLLLLSLSATAQFDDLEDSDLDADQQEQYEEQQEEQQGQQTLTLTRETLDALLQMLSPDCREQMEQAIGNNGDSISMDCKGEIQQGLMALNVAPGQSQQQQAGQQQQQPKAGQRKAPSASRNSESDNTQPAGGPADNSRANSAMFAIGALVVVMVGAAALLVVVRGKNVDETQKAVKKLSKKKEEKMRSKGNR